MAVTGIVNSLIKKTEPFQNNENSNNNSNSSNSSNSPKYGQMVVLLIMVILLMDTWQSSEPNYFWIL